MTILGGRKGDGWLTGQLLIAVPSMQDPRFSRALIYLCSHGPEGAMGLVVNRLYGELSFRALLEQLHVKATLSTPEVPIHFGGPVEPGRGFVLHTDDYQREGTMLFDDGFALTATVEVLKGMAEGEGPVHSLLALGYAGWSAGQLDAEIQANGWLVAPPDPTLLFTVPNEQKWEKALAKIGVSPTMLSGEAGHA